jgi:uncharacterized protein
MTQGIGTRLTADEKRAHLIDIRRSHVSVFDWEHDATEICYVMEGEVKVTTSDGEAVQFGPGDLVTFPRGLKCSWEVRKPIRKHYRFS